MLIKIPHLKSFFLDPHKSSTVFSAFSIVLEKWKLFDKLQIHPEKILKRTNKIGS